MAEDIDPDADRPVYKQLADIVRADIVRGRLGPGSRVDSEQTLVQRHGISRDSVRRAMALLRAEGLIVTTSRGSQVRAAPERTEIVIEPDAVVTARMPTEPERRALAVREGVPILVVQRPGEDPQMYAADRTAIRAGG